MTDAPSPPIQAKKSDLKPRAHKPAASAGKPIGQDSGRATHVLKAHPSEATK